MSGWKSSLPRWSKLEAGLSARSAEYRQAMQAVPLEDLQAALSKDSVLVDFVEYGHKRPADKKARTKATSERRLLGFVVAPDRPMEMVSLGAMQPIDDAIRAWRVTFGMSAEGAAGRPAAPRAVMGADRREAARGEDRAHFARWGPQPVAFWRPAGQDAGELSDRGANVCRGARAAVDPATGARGRPQAVAEESAARGQRGLRRAAGQGPGQHAGDGRRLVE